MPTPRAANRPSRLNRTLLTLIGLILLVTGAFGLAAGLGRLRATLPQLDQNAPLLPAGLTLPVWTTYVALIVAVLLGLACLRWLIAQTQRRPRTGTWTLSAGTSGVHETTTMPADAAAAAIETDIESYRGVRSVTASLAGPRSAPALQLDVSTDDDTSIADLRARIASDALPRLRAALELDALPTQLLLRVAAAASTAPRAR